MYDRMITAEILVAYSHCPRKAFVLLCTEEKGTPHDYVAILQQKKHDNQAKCINALGKMGLEIQPYNTNSLKGASDVLVNSTLKAEGLEAKCDVLTKVKMPSSLGGYSYEPTILVGTHNITKEQKLELLYVGYVLGKIQNKLPKNGTIVGASGVPHKLNLENSPTVLLPLLSPLKEWLATSSTEPPPVILNRHCPYCQFQSLCKSKAEQDDNLSLLEGISSRAIQRYEKKGIFTLKQLSYLFKPRRPRKRAKTSSSTHKPELQALAIRTGRIYIQQLPNLSRQAVELFLDIEGIPDQQAYYLIGLLVSEGHTLTHYSFWADTLQDEAQIWQSVLDKVHQYPDAPVYHYGSYEPRAIDKLSKRYETVSEGLRNRLVNINTSIYGRVYFPVRSNRLKEIGNFIGASWTAPNASGLQSLVWRHHWDETHDGHYKELLVTYNKEDCLALKLLTDELSKLRESANTLSEV